MAYYNEMHKLLLWSKLSIIPGSDDTEWRRDCFGNAIKRSDYGKRDSKYGWEIDHIRPIALGGSNVISNLRAIHWRSNAGMGGYLTGIVSRR